MKIVIDGRQVEAVVGETILMTARKAGIHVPTLCYYEAFEGQGRCRMCMVEVNQGGRKRTVAACTFPVTEGIEVTTSTPQIEKLRKTIVMLLYKKAPDSQLLQQLYRDYGCIDNSLTEHRGESCILCNICVRACEEIGCNSISLIMRGTDKRVATPFDEAAAACIGCGTCAQVCPTNAIPMEEKDGIRTIWNKSFELVNCQRCGKQFSTREELIHISSRAGSTEAYSELCESCRRKLSAEKIFDFGH